MAPEKVTEMVLNVDLKCSGCYKKVKKVICKIPQIRDQVFDVDKNKVRIKVVCCSPENIRDKICYKGGGAIQSIEIVEKPKEAAKPAGDKPKEPEKPKPAGDKPKEPEKPKPAGDKPKEPEKPKPAGDKPKDAGKPKEPEKPKPADKPKDPQKPKEPEKPKPTEKPKDSGKPAEPEKAKPGPPKEPTKKPDAGPNPDVAKMVYEPVHGYPQMYPPSGYPMMGYGQYYDQGYGGGYGGAPFQHGYGMQIAPPPPPPPSYGGFGYETGYNGYHGNRSHYSNEYGGEEDGGCSIM